MKYSVANNYLCMPGLIPITRCLGLFSVSGSLRELKDLLLLAKDDEQGRKLQDAGLITKKRAPKK